MSVRQLKCVLVWCNYKLLVMSDKEESLIHLSWFGGVDLGSCDDHIAKVSQEAGDKHPWGWHHTIHCLFTFAQWKTYKATLRDSNLVTFVESL